MKRATKDTLWILATGVALVTGMSLFEWRQDRREQERELDARSRGTYR